MSRLNHSVEVVDPFLIFRQQNKKQTKKEVFLHTTHNWNVQLLLDVAEATSKQSYIKTK